MRGHRRRNRSTSAPGRRHIDRDPSARRHLCRTPPPFRLAPWSSLRPAIPAWRKLSPRSSPRSVPSGEDRKSSALELARRPSCFPHSFSLMFFPTSSVPDEPHPRKGLNRVSPLTHLTLSLPLPYSLVSSIHPAHLGVNFAGESIDVGLSAVYNLRCAYRVLLRIRSGPLVGQGGGYDRIYRFMRWSRSIPTPVLLPCRQHRSSLLWGGTGDEADGEME